MSKGFGEYVDEMFNNAKKTNFEDVFTKTKTFTEEIGKKGAEHIEISRKKIECLDLRAKLCKAYEKFGRVQYKTYIDEDANEEEIAEALSEIASLQDRLDTLTAELELMKNKETI